jgi:5-methylcytosine-specific restriction endonuclease McrA
MPVRILREGILTSERVDLLSPEALPDPRNLMTVEEVLAVRLSLPRVNAGHWLQSYKWNLSLRLRALRGAAIPDALARKLIAEAPENCPVCGLVMKYWISRRTPSIDHVVAVANGGKSEETNLRVICNRCNSRKRDRA